MRKSRRRAAARSGRLLAVHGKRLPRRTAFNRLLALPGARVIDVSFTAEGVVVEIALRRRRAACSGCGQVCRSVHDRSRRRWRHLDLAGQRLHVEYCVRRVRCPDCGVRVEAVPFARPRARHTRDFEDLTAFLAKQMAKTPIAPSWRPTTPYRRRHGQRTVYYPVDGWRGGGSRVAPARRGAGSAGGVPGTNRPQEELGPPHRFMAQLPDHVRLVIAGDGPADLIYSLRRRAAGLGVSGRLEWLGFVEPGDRTRFLENVDLLAMPSAFESFGLSAAEAMLHGVPVLVSERTGIAEVISRHGGGRITEAGASAIATAIGELDAERGALSKMGARGQAAVREELDYTRIGQALRDAYADAVG